MRQFLKKVAEFIDSLDRPVNLRAICAQVPDTLRGKVPQGVRHFYEKIGLRCRILVEGYRKWSLKAKLVGMMLALSFASALLLFVMDSRGVREIALAVQSQNEDLSQAFQISVDEITTQGFTNQARLQDFISTLKRKGVKEISILSNERQVLESSNPKKVGKVIAPKHKDFLITGAVGDDESEDGSPRKIYNLVIPVVVGSQQLGYVNLKLHLEDFDALLDSLRARRLFAIVLVFGLGVLGAFFLASRYTQPIGSIVDAARAVAHGDLDHTVKVEHPDEVGELARTFNDMVERLREARELQQKLARAEHMSRLGQLSAGIAHEIRNPLNYLSLSLDQLKDTIARGGDKEKMTASVATMKQEILRLSHLVRNFLSYGKPLKLAKDSVNVKKLIDDSVQMIGDRVADQNISLNVFVDGDVKLLGDRELLKSCVTNVIINAIQAVGDGGKIDVRVLKKSADKKLVVEVVDNGCGIPEEKLANIGEPFFSTKEGGVGIGLAITKKIISEHDGKFYISSVEGRGTTVAMHLPLYEC